MSSRAIRKIDPKKAAFRKRLLELLDAYSKVLIVEADNVASNQLHQIRRSLRGKAEILMGKNTQIRTAIEVKMKPEKDSSIVANPKLSALRDQVKLNVGLVFTNGDLSEIRDILLSNRIGAPAKVGAFAPTNVVVPAGNTGLDPNQTSFFQALNITTKIVKGTIEIQQDVTILKTGDKVGSSEAALLAKLNIRPFTYGLKVVQIYENGAVFSPAVLDIKDEDFYKFFAAGVSNVTAVSLGAGIPTVAAVPHVLINGFKDVLSIALGSAFSFPLADRLKDAIANPAAAAAAPAAAAAAAPAAAAKAPEPEPEPEDDDMGFSLFD